MNPPCEPCFPGVAVTEDPSHPSTRHLPERWNLVDEFHNYLVNPRAKVHVLTTLDEESYKHNLNVLKEGAWERGVNDLMGDHPISWCHNFEGGRAWFQGLGHNRELFHDPTYLKIVLGGIQTSAGILPANCTSYKEVANLISSYQAQAPSRSPRPPSCKTCSTRPSRTIWPTTRRPRAGIWSSSRRGPRS